ncbi:lipopolysaccharide biosynthesis protein [Desertivirga brevis]|uniref:lipopolysaccharide biosynthesis protein n=1 Tax=Desertivirga brevis TaxID=2810310 RepID=UPI001A959BFF|nr:lipopolysaccharide biosynthesis protein [Pedobacter sp. SYSU D00873]
MNEEISLRDVFTKIRRWYIYLLAHWKLLFSVSIIGLILGYLYAEFKSPKFTAVCTFVLEDAGTNGGLGEYLGLASMIGVDLGGGKSSGIFQGENIFELYRSRRMIKKTLLSSVSFKKHEALLIDRYIKFNKLNNKWQKKSYPENIQFNIPENKFTLAHDSIINEIVKDITKNYLKVEKPDKKLSIISVKVTSIDELFAKSFTNKLVENVNQFYIETKTKTSLENVKLLQKQADSVRRILNTSIRATALAMDVNPSPNAALLSLRVPAQHKQIDVQSSSAIYAEVAKNLEIAKISLRKATPLIQIIDEPVLPLDKERPSKILSSLGISFLLTSLTVIILSLMKIIR